MSITVCPKCGYQRQASDHHVMAGICPACGIAYQKWLERQDQQDQLSPQLSPQHPQSPQKPEESTSFSVAESVSLSQRIKAWVFYVPENIEPVGFWGRVLLLGVFFIWGWSFILGGISWESIGGSFLHNVILPFHEFGHVLFSPFGRFMAILGGSLFQVLMPLGLMLAFLIKQRDAFGASIMLWWSGQSFIDISPYIADAPYRAIPLIRGMGEGAHDWGNLLTMTNSMDMAMPLARVSFGIGSLLMMVSFAWGAYLLWLQKAKMVR